MARMRTQVIICTGVVVLFGAWLAVGQQTLSVPEKQVDAQKIYWGVATGFTRPGEVRYDDIIKETPEFVELRKKKIERGTGKYWILMSEASDRVIQAISKTAQSLQHDFIAAQGYLGSLEPPIAAPDITDEVLKTMSESSSS